MTDSAQHRQFVHEQATVNTLYVRLDELRTSTAELLREVRASESTGTHQSRAERDAFAALYESRLAQLMGVEDRLVFGRLDMASAESLYVGRLGLSTNADERLLVDWRAPAARAFYAATAASPEGVARRRHVTVRARDVVALEDDVLDFAALESLGLTDLHGEGALMAAVSATRTGRMGDIVSTIQAEQDAVIRDSADGFMVVQGGPGTGKTAVSLHRAAYLLYTHRERLAASGVLVVGPSRGFMRYIEHVLPSLGETGTVMLTPGELVPDVTATTHDVDETAVVKGDLRMVEVLRRAVDRYQEMPATGLECKYSDVRLRVSAKALESARRSALHASPQHNVARATFLTTVLNHLVDAYSKAMSTVWDPQERPEVLADLRSDRLIARQLNRLWLPLTPQLVLSGLFALPERLDAAAPDLSESERMALWRDPDQQWTVEDVPLLDEIADLIGEATDELAPARRGAEERYAQEVLEMLGADGTVSASELSARFRESGPVLSVADRAVADRQWTYGHVVVDEAQELSPMAWRTVLKRIPSKSVTAVGDVAQGRSASAATTWSDALGQLLGDRFRVHELTVNYRSPARVMEVARAFARAHGLPVTESSSVREGDRDPVLTHCDDVCSGAVAAAVAAVAENREARVALVVPQAHLAEVVAAAHAEPGLPDVGEGPAAVDHEVAVMTAPEAKGLEFDVVVLAEPAVMVEESRRGAADVYVALTRATQWVQVVHSESLPMGFEEVASAVR